VIADKFCTNLIKMIPDHFFGVWTPSDRLPNVTNRQVDLSIFYLQIPKSLFKARYTFRYTHDHILLFCIAKGELLYSPGSYKHLKLPNYGHLIKIGQLEYGITLEPSIHKIKRNAFWKALDFIFKINY
jgi:hypothetical protein